MWYFLFRFIALAVIVSLFIVCIFCIPWLRKKTRRTKVIAFILFLIILLIFLPYPYENFFFHFKTPEEAFAYSHFGAAIQTVSVEDTCAFVVYSSGGQSADPDVIEKGPYGWNINSPFSPRNGGSKHWSSTDTTGKSKTFFLNVVQSEQSRQLFIMIHRFDSVGNSHEIADIHDTLDSLFQIHTSDSYLSHIEYYYTVLDVDDVDDHYQIYVDGKPVDPFKDLYQKSEWSAIQ
ncbi:hypothetical protein [Solibaculum mannosilyticum]|uniref:Uncharacterized protein n=1 Tax=Solibaculum mannosilyticum TaxID=2780922 RepID=A0A7I8D2E4_9FIRM|nr:hypothetical protein [Solibaculum mannosilyticum]BCI61000.1 hypothetical protein C12CBH8_16390 [Solibaculum mannosilyticum]